MTDLEKAQEILAMLKAENISTDPYARAIKIVREFTGQTVATLDVPAPGLTTCTATTLLKRGLCLEMTQRFVLEYVLKYKQQNISMLFTSVQGKIHTDNHMFAIIGNIKAPERLFIGNGASEMKISGNIASYLPIETFIENNKNNIVVDALLGCAGTFNSPAMQPLTNYIKENKITHLMAVRSFHNCADLIRNAPIIKLNAFTVAATVDIEMKRQYLAIVTNLVAPGEWKYIKSQNYFAFEATDAKNIPTVHDDLQSKGFLADKELTIATTVQTMKTLLFLKNGNELALARFEALGESVADRYKSQESTAATTKNAMKTNTK